MAGVRRASVRASVLRLARPDRAALDTDRICNADARVYRQSVRAGGSAGQGLMGRILFFVLLAIAVYVLWKWLHRQSSTGGSAVRRTDACPAPAMSSCGPCGAAVSTSDGT